jgi:hypothetical protein
MAILDLEIGPAEGGLTVEELSVAWEVERAGVMDRLRVGSRPWAYWWFELGEDKPRNTAAEAVRLAELGELGAGELAALRERATEAGLRVGTPAERVSGGSLSGRGVSMDARAVELWEAVRRAVAARASDSEERKI